MNTNQILVAGGGAAGLMAAGQAANAGAKIILIEKMHRPARKLRISGKGRCNITNVVPVEEFINHFGFNGSFLRQVFAQFFSEDLLAFFQEIGVSAVTERGGRIFPASGDAKLVVDRLVAWVRHHRVRFLTEHTLLKLKVKNQQIKGVAVQSLKDQSIKEIDCIKVIVSTGGQSYPATGSTGDGYSIAESVGHSLVPVRPALVPLITKIQIPVQLHGLALRNVRASLFIKGKKKADEFGEMVFTEKGLSGPIILTMSRQAVDALHEDNDVVISIDLKPALNTEKLDARLLREVDSHGKRNITGLLKTLLPHQLIMTCLEQTRLSPHKPSHQITAEERIRLLEWLKDFRLPISGHGSFDEAIITAGGINLKEVNPKTMESRLITGLYFAGEILDLDGDTGGYNLQAAFSTGWVAGRNAALAL